MDVAIQREMEGLLKGNEGLWEISGRNYEGLN